MSGKAWAAERLFKARAADTAEEFRRWLLTLRPGTPWRSGSLTLVPLMAEGASGPRDILLPEAIGLGQIEVAEQGSGVVNQVVARNRGPRDVLVLEGDTLVGAKQNRMVAWTVIVAAGSAVAVSVGCMERGRWSRGGGRFSSGAMSVDPHIRRRTKQETIAASATSGAPLLDQHRAWQDVDRQLEMWNVASETADYHSGLSARTARQRELVREIRPVDRQIGVIALHDDRLLGLEVVGHPDTWRVLADRVLPSYALGADLARLDPDFRRVPSLPHPEAWLEAVRGSQVQERRAAGKGVDLLLRDGVVRGTCLWEGGAVRHMAVFA